MNILRENGKDGKSNASHQKNGGDEELGKYTGEESPFHAKHIRSKVQQYYNRGEQKRQITKLSEEIDERE